MRRKGYIDGPVARETSEGWIRSGLSCANPITGRRSRAKCWTKSFHHGGTETTEKTRMKPRRTRRRMKVCRLVVASSSCTFVSFVVSFFVFLGRLRVSVVKSTATALTKSQTHPVTKSAVGFFSYHVLPPPVAAKPLRSNRNPQTARVC